MRHLKTFKSLNESTSGECDFEAFKEIMYDITDEFSSFEFSDYSSEEYGSFYDCQIDIVDSEFYDYYSTLDFSELLSLDVVEPIDGPDNIEGIYKEGKVYTEINWNIDKLLDFKKRIDAAILSNQKMIKLFKNVEEFVLPRFQTFSNFIQCDVGLSNGRLRITFEMEGDKDNDYDDD